MHMCIFLINHILTLKSYFVSGWKTAPWEKKQQKKAQYLALFLLSPGHNIWKSALFLPTPNAKIQSRWTNYFPQEQAS